MSWLGLCVLDPSALLRFMLGRPFLASVAALITLGLLWRRMTGPRLDLRGAALCALAVALAAWTHPSWYLFALFLAAVLAAGERRAALRLAGCVAVGCWRVLWASLSRLGSRLATFSVVGDGRSTPVI
jgi:hypothetical protein